MPPFAVRLDRFAHATIAALAGVAALAAAPAAQAQAHARTHRCKPAARAFTSLVASDTVSCTEARDLNRYMMTHETLSGAFRLRGETWRGKVYARSHGRTAMVYRHDRQKVWLTFRGSAS